MLIKIDNAYSQVITTDTALKSKIDRILSYEVQGAQFSKRIGWDGRNYLIDKKGIFPTGLLAILVRWLKLQSVPYKFEDVRPTPPPQNAYTMNLPFEPRNYQLEAAATDRTRGVFVMGTGSGKTLVSALLVAKRGVPTLVVTPDTGLREQLYGNYAAWFGEKMVGKTIDDPRPIIVANIQHLANKKPEQFLKFSMMICDEFHHASSRSYQTVNSYCRNAFYRYGFTGTFMRSDGMDMLMHGVLSQVVYKKTTSELIEEGYLVRPEITMLKHLIPRMQCDYARAYKYITLERAFNEKIAVLATQKAFGEGKQTLILVRRVEHGRILESMIGGSHYLSGDDASEHRERIKNQFINKKFSCLIATNIFGEGTDIPSIDVLINARCQKTEIQTAQGIGRALRLCEGKDRAEVFDFIIEGQKHLRDHSLERLKTYRKEAAFKITVMT